jgi:hypothetical protein
MKEYRELCLRRVTLEYCDNHYSCKYCPKNPDTGYSGYSGVFVDDVAYKDIKKEINMRLGLYINVDYATNDIWHHSSCYELYVDQDDDCMTHFVQGVGLKLKEELRLYIRRKDGFTEYAGNVGIEPEEADNTSTADIKFTLRNWQFYKQFYTIKFEDVEWTKLTHHFNIRATLMIYDAVGRVANPRTVDIGW